MSFQHQELALGRWQQMTLIAQMANIGSEVERFLSWRTKNNPELSRKAFNRALELIELTLVDPKHSKRLKEIARLRETFLGDYIGNEQVPAIDASWRKYFMHFALAARKNR
ncbi:MAG: hypothetical protein AB1439_07160 [candidate division FCPU426 bacterium]